MSIALHSERSSYNDDTEKRSGARRKRYSHPIRAIHYSAPEQKVGRAEKEGNHTGRKMKG